MKEIINPAYGRFEDFVRRVPRIFSEEGKTIYKARNEIKVFEVDGVELNVKRYRVPLLINRVIYRFFRQPKAVRAYEYALRLVAKGFETPAPIAYAASLCSRFPRALLRLAGSAGMQSSPFRTQRLFFARCHLEGRVSGSSL